LEKKGINFVQGAVKELLPLMEETEKTLAQLRRQREELKRQVEQAP